MSSSPQETVSQNAELILNGIGVFPGIVWGNLKVLDNKFKIPKNKNIFRDQIESEKQRLIKAIEETKEQIEFLKKDLINNKNNSLDYENNSEIFDSHISILEDKALLDKVFTFSKSKLKSSEWSYYSVFKHYYESLKKISDPYIKERSIDIKDVSQRVLKNLNLSDNNKDNKEDSLEQKSIVLANEISPSEVVDLINNNVKAFATQSGSLTSHAAIIAKSLSIPTVVSLHNIPFSNLDNYNIALVDGYKGILILDPSEETISNYSLSLDKEEKLFNKLDEVKNKSTSTKDGKDLILSANMEFLSELESISYNKAEGVGLFRTEFFYFYNKNKRSEDDQFKVYSQIAKSIFPNSVIIRTLDIGGDKEFPEEFLTNPEPNPFLGWRGIRLSLDNSDEFRVQIKAILRASAFGKVKIMFPFISTLEEIIEAKKQLSIVKDELNSNNIEYDKNIEVGAMIEIPSAALISDHIAKEVDFLSIGTNDLIQYTTAVDRISDRVSHLYDPANPGVIHLIKEVIEASHRNNIWCGLCGESASDPIMTPLWVGMGIDELSVGSSQVLRIRHAISCLDSGECKHLCDEILKYPTGESIRKSLLDFSRDIYPELFN